MDCTHGTRVTLSENLSNVSTVSKVSGIVPVAYLQNWLPINDFHANFHHLRWFISWSIAFGVHEFANFISHDSDGDEQGRHNRGLLDSRNDMTPLGGDQQSAFGFMRYIHRELASVSITVAL